MNQSERLRRKRIQLISNEIEKLPGIINSNLYAELKGFSSSSIPNTPKLNNILIPQNKIYVYDTFINPICNNTDYFCNINNRINRENKTQQYNCNNKIKNISLITNPCDIPCYAYRNNIQQ